MKSLILATTLASLASVTTAQFKLPLGGKPPSSPQGNRPDTVPTEQLPPSQFPWRNPFSNTSSITSYTSDCSASKTFKASEFKLDDMQEEAPLGVAPYFNVLKDVLGTREYPGSWDGKDPHGYDRQILQMEYSDVPVRVREWIEERERSDDKENRGLFVVFQKQPKGRPAQAPAKLPEIGAERTDDAEKTVLFAPGAMYGVLPLWVADGSKCADTLLDADKYATEPADGAVVAWVTEHTKPKRGLDKRDITFTIKAQHLKSNPDAKKAQPAEDAQKDEPKKAAKDEL